MKPEPLFLSFDKTGFTCQLVKFIYKFLCCTSCDARILLCGGTLLIHPTICRTPGFPRVFPTLGKIVTTFSMTISSRCRQILKANIYVGALRLRAQKISNPGKCSFLQGWQTICSVSLRAPWAMFVIFKYNGMT